MHHRACRGGGALTLQVYRATEGIIDSDDDDDDTDDDTDTD